MALNDLPAAIQSVIQTGFLERRFNQALKAKLGFRAIADREPFAAAIGESLTKTRVGLLPAVTTPMAPAAVTDITSGLTNQNYSVEQYTLGIAQYAAPMQLNIATANVAIDDLYLQNAYALGEQALRSVDTLAQHALFDQYMGGNTFVTTTLGSPATAVHVDDVRGFFNSMNTLGQVVATSSSFPLTVAFNNGGTITTYTLNSVLADGTAPATIVPWLANLAFSGTSSNSSITPGGYSGTLTFSTNVTVANGTAGNAAVAATAPSIFRPSNASTNVMAPATGSISSTADTNNGKITIQMILTAKATLSANGVPPVTAAGNYVLFADPIQLTGLFQDPAFQMFFRGQVATPEYKKGVVAELMQVVIVETNLNPVQTYAGVGTVRRAALCGQGALVEGVFTRRAYEATSGVDDGQMTTVVDDIAHITREPIDALKQVVTQSWSYIGGFVAPTDTTTSPTTIPTASNAALKRAAIIESL
jgi:hypothetical protein